MKSQDIRKSFLDFFAQRDHRVLASGPLVPHGDATLLFTNAGMVPFKNVFLGLEEAPHPRATTAQKCLRVSGKHNDLENVGPSPRHHTFFEMLGNFSFGDYFKEQAIRDAWELVTEVWGLPVEHLYATVFEEDDEAHELWNQLSSLPPERILRCGAKDNFWAMGETGPCGPCSEIFVDTRPEEPSVDFEEGSETGRYLEIWNLVFMEFQRGEDGELRPLPNPSIDTGAGLERLAAVLQGVGNNYDSDLFQPILQATTEISPRREELLRGEVEDGVVSLRVIADHLRAVTFLLSDGVIPGNEGRGYVLRRILRRALRHGMGLGFEEPFLYRLVPVLEEVLGDAYPQLAQTREATVATVRAEEEKFLSTLATGARLLQQEIDGARREGAERLGGERVFRLYDTYGLPVEVIREIAEEERFGIDEKGFEAELEAQRERARRATGEGQKRVGALTAALAGAADEETEFLGYDQLELEDAEVLRLAVLSGGDALAATALTAGQEGAVVLDRTVFYAEGGGQVGDVGRLRWEGGSARVTDTRKGGGIFFHFLEVEEGQLQVGAKLSLEVTTATRREVQRHHTATHLLHAALRERLGSGVRQAGSLVAADRLRFDFTYPEPVSAEILDELESRINGWVLEALPLRTAYRSYEEAVAAGAMALFGEKYGDVVRTVEIADASLELCGGCHVGNTGEIGMVLLTGEKGIASGVRRVEAVAGEAALALVRQQRGALAEVARAVGVGADQAATEIVSLKGQIQGLEDELSRLRLEMVAGAASDAGSREETVGEVKVRLQQVPMAPPGELRNMADTLRSKVGSGVVALGAAESGKVTLLVAVTEDLVGQVHAGKIVKAAAAVVGGGGGGRPDFAQAGGKDESRLPEALDVVVAEVRAQLEG
ncbi:MAG: alanine--tRNA ligase [Acidobacteriota bacterium]